MRCVIPPENRFVRLIEPVVRVVLQLVIDPHPGNGIERNSICSAPSTTGIGVPVVVHRCIAFYPIGKERGNDEGTLSTDLRDDEQVLLGYWRVSIPTVVEMDGFVLVACAHVVRTPEGFLDLGELPFQLGSSFDMLQFDSISFEPCQTVVIERVQVGRMERRDVSKWFSLSVFVRVSEILSGVLNTIMLAERRYVERDPISIRR